MNAATAQAPTTAGTGSCSRCHRPVDVRLVKKADGSKSKYWHCPCSKTQFCLCGAGPMAPNGLKSHQGFCKKYQTLTHSAGVPQTTVTTAAPKRTTASSNLEPVDPSDLGGKLAALIDDRAKAKADELFQLFMTEVDRLEASYKAVTERLKAIEGAKTPPPAAPETTPPAIPDLKRYATPRPKPIKSTRELLQKYEKHGDLVKALRSMGCVHVRNGYGSHQTWSTAGGFKFTLSMSERGGRVTMMEFKNVLGALKREGLTLA